MYHVNSNFSHLIGERQKRTLQTLQDIVGGRNGLFFDPAADGGRTLQPENGSYGVTAAEFDSVLDPTWPLPGLPTSFSDSSIDDAIGGEELLDNAYFDLEYLKGCDIMSYLLQQSDMSISERLKSLIREQKITLKDVLKAGLEAVSDEISPEIPRSASVSGHCERLSINNNSPLRTDKILLLQHREALPDIRRNNIRIKQVLFTAACVANASTLGLSFELASCGDAVSPFFRESVSEDEANTACLSSFRDLKEHLRPCATQLMYAHHPYIDVLPFPTFRERVIKLAYTELPMIDDDDLCRDLENDGLVCWGSALGGGSVATGSGAPWDIRSWEAQSWFLKKWWILIGGAEGEIYKQTRWWRNMRGDQSGYPW
jgi:hypothetical protein